MRVSADKLTYRFRLRPEARFHDGSPVTARRRRLLAQRPEGEGPPDLSRRPHANASTRRPRATTSLVVRFAPEPQPRPASDRSSACRSSPRPIGRDARLRGLDARAAARLGPYKVGRFEQGRFIEFERVAGLLGQGPAGECRASNNFDRMRFEYYRDRQVAFEAFKAGAINFREEYTSRIWATGYDFPAVRDGRVKKETLPTARRPARRAGTSTRAASNSRIRASARRIGLAFDFEWTNKNIMFGLYKRTDLVLRELGHEGDRQAAARRSWRCSSRSAARCPTRCSASLTCRRSRTARARTAALLQPADELLRAAGCKRDGSTLKLPGRQAVRRSSSSTRRPRCSRTPSRSCRISGGSASRPRSRIVDAAQYNAAHGRVRFRRGRAWRSAARCTPGDDLQRASSARSSRQAPARATSPASPTRSSTR